MNAIPAEPYNLFSGHWKENVYSIHGPHGHIASGIPSPAAGEIVKELNRLSESYKDVVPVAFVDANGDIIPKRQLSPWTNLYLEDPKVETRLEEAEEALRSLACWLSVGGYNDYGEFDAKSFENRIRQGIEMVIEAEVNRRMKMEKPE